MRRLMLAAAGALVSLAVLAAGSAAALDLGYRMERRGDTVTIRVDNPSLQFITFGLDADIVASTNEATGRPVLFERTPTGKTVISVEKVSVPTEKHVMRLTVKGGRAARLQYARDLTEAKTRTGADGFVFRYRLHEPKGLKPGEKAPLVVFLHGAGERGKDNAVQMNHGVPQILKYAEDRMIPLFLVAGQVPGGTGAEFPEGQKWVQVPWGAYAEPVAPMPAEPSASMRALFAVVGDLRKDPRVDTSRIYVTGVSMGGYGTWDFALRHPDWVAAALPVCAGVDVAKVPLAKGVKFWIFHGGSDSVVAPARGRSSYEAAKKAGLDVRYTEYPGIDHNSWDLVYVDENALDWMFAQRRK